MFKSNKFKSNKKILVMLVVFGLFLSKNIFAKDIKDINVEDLHIFNILTNAKFILMEKGVGKQKDLGQKSIELVDMQVNLLREIIDGFNRGLLINVEFRFLGICNFLKELEIIAPRNIRAFKRKLIKFDDFIQKYPKSNGNLLTAQEIELCEKIIKFEQMLFNCFLRHDFYDIALTDEFVDLCFFRPVEWVGNHPVISTAVVFAVLAILFYYYLYPYLNSSDDVKMDGYVLIKNKNPNGVVVIQFKQEKTQGWTLTCGAHALFNLIAMIKGGGDDKKTYELVNSQEEKNKMFTHWQKVLIRKDEEERKKLAERALKDPAHWKDCTVPSRNGLNSLDGADIIKILQEEHLENVHVIEDSGMLKAENLDSFNSNGAYQMREGVPQLFIVNTAERTEADDSYGHWLPFMLTKDKKAKDGIKVLTADSMGGNVTGHWQLDRLHNILVHGS